MRDADQIMKQLNLRSKSDDMDSLSFQEFAAGLRPLVKFQIKELKGRVQELQNKQERGTLMRQMSERNGTSQTRDITNPMMIASKVSSEAKV